MAWWARALLCVTAAQAGDRLCKEGDKIEARWTDGSYKVATIMEVRRGGTCGIYKITWGHTQVCGESSSNFWGDDTNSKAFCLIGKEAIRPGPACPADLPCHDRTSSEDTTTTPPPDENDRSNTTVVFAILGVVACPIIGICFRMMVQMVCRSNEWDEESSQVDGTPRSLWDQSPKNVAATPGDETVPKKPAGLWDSSPTAKWRFSMHDPSPKSNTSKCSSPMHAWATRSFDLSKYRRYGAHKTKIAPQDARGSAPAITLPVQKVSSAASTSWRPDSRGSVSLSQWPQIRAKGTVDFAEGGDVAETAGSGLRSNGRVALEHPCPPGVEAGRPQPPRERPPPGAERGGDAGVETV